MSAYMKTVVAPASYAAAPDVSLDFEPNQLILQPTGSSDAIFSFDGVNDHGYLMGGTNQTQAMNLHLFVKQKKVWVKQAAGAVSVRVMAYTSA
jgi:hypothetical protein